MSTANIAESPKPELTRIVLPEKRIPKEKMTKIDYEGIMSAWTPKTNILDRIKRNDPKTTIKVKITPDMALDILTLNDMNHNRDIDKKRIKEYSTFMKDMKWMEGNGDTIRISEDMKLLDGQHRLWSIWISKKTIEFIIVTGLPPKAFAYIDIGKNRTAKDTTEINGYKNISAPASAAIKLIILWERKGIVKSSISASDVPNFEVNDWQQNTQNMNWLLKALDMIKIKWMEQTNNFFTAPQWLAVFYILQSLPNRKKQAEEFLNQFAAGDELRKGSPIRVARTYFEKDMEQFIKYKRRRTVNLNILTIKIKVLFEAWNLNLAKKTVSEINIDQSTVIIKKPNWQSEAI